MRYARRFVCWGPWIFLHRRQIFSKICYPVRFSDLDTWLYVSQKTIIWCDWVLILDRIQCACNGVPMLIVGRIINGLCVGIASSIVPIYQSEIAPKEIRGRVVALQQWAITWGILIQFFVQSVLLKISVARSLLIMTRYGASWIDGGPSNVNQSTAAFRIPWAIQMIPGFILFIGLFFFPMSPRWVIFILSSKYCSMLISGS